MVKLLGPYILTVTLNGCEHLNLNPQVGSSVIESETNHALLSTQQ